MFKGLFQTEIVSKFIALIIIPITLLQLQSCSFAPKYQRPPMDIPVNYKEAGNWARANPDIADRPRGPWWEAFGDPALNALEVLVDANNQNLQAAYDRFLEAKAAADIAKASFFPVIGALASATWEKASTATTASSNANSTASNKPFGQFVVAADFTYEVDVWGRIRNAVAQSVNLAKASAADLATMNLSIHAELASDYFSLRGDDEAQRVLDETVNVYQKALVLTRDRHKNGAVSGSDVDQAESQLENAKTLAADMHIKRAQMEHAIAVLIGLPPENFSMAPARSKMAYVLAFTNLPSTLLERRPDIAAAERRVQAANAGIGVARAAFFPVFDLIAEGGFQSSTLSNLFSKNSLFWSLGPSSLLALSNPTVQFTVFDGGRLLGQLKQANASYYEAVANYRQTVLTALKEVEDSLIALRQLENEHRTQSLAAETAYRATNKAHILYKGGIYTYLDVVVLQNTALQSELSSINVLTQRQLASVQLVKALGGGWAVE